jgi:hypothetical protein
MPGDYDAGFTSCQGDDTEPMGVYGSSTFYQGEPTTPDAHTPGATSKCSTVSTIGSRNTVAIQANATTTTSMTSMVANVTSSGSILSATSSASSSGGSVTAVVKSAVSSASGGAVASGSRSGSSGAAATSSSTAGQARSVEGVGAWMAAVLGVIGGVVLAI